MPYSIGLQTRAFAAMPFAERFNFQPVRFSWNARGGPERMDVDVTGDPNLMALMLDWLRCPITLYNDDGEAVWWGYVSSLTFDGIPVAITANIESIANRVAALYTTSADDCLADGITAKTAWADNLASQSLYGIKELIHPVGNATLATAEAARDNALALLEQPMSAMQLSQQGAGSGSLVCQGWYETLGWEYYTRLDTDDTETSIQMSDIIELCGQFFNGVTVKDRSNLSEPEYQEGNSTGLVILEQLMDKGISGGNRYLLTVDKFRNILIYQEPGSTDPIAQVAVNQYGQFANAMTSAPFPPGYCPVGVWLQWLGSIQQTTALPFQSKPVPAFIERMEIDCTSNQPNWTLRGQPDPWKQSGVQDG